MCNKTQSFEAWMCRVEENIQHLTGLSSSDLPECCYGDWYDDGVGPLTAAKRAIRMTRYEEE